MIEFNGKQYDSVEAMPPEERRAYEKAMEMLAKVRQGALDNLPAETGQPETGQQRVVISRSTIVVDGKTYHSKEDMPPEVRRRYEDALTQWHRLADAAGDEPPAAPAVVGEEAGPGALPPEASPPLAPAASPVVQEAHTSVSGVLVVIGAAALVLLLLVAAGLVGLAVLR